LGFGSYFCYDNPGALEKHIETDMHVTTSTYMGLYSWYSWPNVILCFFGGFLIDRLFGIRMGAIIFTAFVMGGQVVFALGAFLNQFWLMDLGRFIFGIGGESLAVAQNTYAVSWFRDKELNMVFGLQLSLSRVGSTVNFNVMEPIYDAMPSSYVGYERLGIALFIGSLTCVLSFVCALVLAIFDKRAEIILEKDAAKTGEVVKITDAKDFVLQFWLLCIICVAAYVAIFPFISLGAVFFQMKFGLSPSAASTLNSIVYVISAVMSPILGFMIDKLGRNLLWVLAAVFLTGLSHALLAFTFINPWFAMVTMGVSYSMLASALWPMVSLVIEERQLGSAYGIMQSFQNLGLAVVALIAGALVDNSGYLVLEVFFIDCLCVALMATVLLLVIDASRDGILNMSPAQRTEFKKSIEDKKTKEEERKEDSN
jgi:MFS family permease